MVYRLHGIRNKVVVISLLVIIVIGLSSCNGDSTPVVNSCTPPSSDSLLFHDDFSNVYTGWPTYHADLSYYESGYAISDQESEYHIRITEPRHSVPFIRNRTLGVYSDFFVQVDCRLATDNSVGYYGLAFRRSSDTPNGYRFIVSTNGQYWIEQITDDGFSLLAEWTKSDSIYTGGGQVNRLAVECRGSQITICVNSQLLTTVTGMSEPEGYIALFAATAEQSNVSFYFDDFYLYIYP